MPAALKWGTGAVARSRWTTSPGQARRKDWATWREIEASPSEDESMCSRYDMVGSFRGGSGARSQPRNESALRTIGAVIFTGGRGRNGSEDDQRTVPQLAG